MFPFARALSRLTPRLSSSEGITRFLSAAANKSDIKDMVQKSKVVVFMKGVPDSPRCGFSNAVVQVLRMHGVEYEAHDVLESEELRQGVKDFSSWPTIPQVFIGGEFVGGCDILLQMHQSGELVETLEKVGVRSALLDSSTKEKSGPDK